jgi:hypothetical protein
MLAGPAHRAAAPRRGLYTIWDLVEHMRIAQEDNLRYALEPGWRSPKWPDGYWPAVHGAGSSSSLRGLAYRNGKPLRSFV